MGKLGPVVQLPARRLSIRVPDAPWTIRAERCPSSYYFSLRLGASQPGAIYLVYALGWDAGEEQQIFLGAIAYFGAGADASYPQGFYYDAPWLACMNPAYRWDTLRAALDAAWKMNRQTLMGR